MQILNTALPELLLVGAARLLGIKKARLSSIKKKCAGDSKRCSSGGEKFPHAPLQKHKTIRRYLPQITPCSFPLERLLARPATGVGVKSAARCRKTHDELRVACLHTTRPCALLTCSCRRKFDVRRKYRAEATNLVRDHRLAWPSFIPRLRPGACFCEIGRAS